MPAPPSRYRVVERDRRLEVIDRWAGREAVEARLSSPPPDGASPRAVLPRQVRFDGGSELTTLAFYDAKGPRTIRLDAARAATIGRVKLAVLGGVLLFVAAAFVAPWIVFAPALLTQKRVRESIRAAITRWLDAAAE